MWATFSEKTGRLSGRPDQEDIGDYIDTAIAATDVNGCTDHLGPFSIRVATPNVGGIVVGLDSPLLLAPGEEPPMLGTLPLYAIYDVGAPITGSWTFYLPNGTPIRDELTDLFLYQVDLGNPDKLRTRLLHERIHFDTELGAYRIEITTEGLEPGVYDILLRFPDMKTELWFRVRIAGST